MPPHGWTKIYSTARRHWIMTQGSWTVSSNKKKTLYLLLLNTDKIIIQVINRWPTLCMYHKHKKLIFNVETTELHEGHVSSWRLIIFIWRVGLFSQNKPSANDSQCLKHTLYSEAINILKKCGHFHSSNLVESAYKFTAEKAIQNICEFEQGQNKSSIYFLFWFVLEGRFDSRNTK